MINPLHLIGCTLTGFVLGALYFYLLYRSLRLQVSSSHVSRFALYGIARFLAAAAVFWWLAQQGVLPLLAALVGFILARTAAMPLVRTV